MAEDKRTQGTAEFDWDALAMDGYSIVERSEMSDKYETTLNAIAEREVIEGTVVSMSKKEVVINIGSKSEGVVATSEFRYNPNLAVGDKVPIYVETQEDRFGQLVVSHRIARVHSAWNKVNEVLSEWDGMTVNERTFNFPRYKDRDDLIAKNSEEFLRPFAFIKEGVWHNRGETGEWTPLLSEEESNSWSSVFNAMYDSLPPDTLLTIVDCHI